MRVETEYLPFRVLEVLLFLYLFIFATADFLMQGRTLPKVSTGLASTDFCSLDLKSDGYLSENVGCASICTEAASYVAPSFVFAFL